MSQWRQRTRYFAISMLIASVPIVLTAMGRRTITEDGRAPEPLARVVGFAAVQWYPWVLVAPFIDWRVRRSRPERRFYRLRAAAEHGGLWLTFGLAHGWVVRTADAAFAATPPTTLPPLTRQLWPDAILYAAVLTGFVIAETRRRHTEVAERLRAEVAEARLDALRQQLNPHFLFNTLNHIVMQLRSRDMAAAEGMLLNLSDLLRDVLRERAQVIPLRDEVRMVERYLEIERARFGERLQAQVTFEPRALDALVPSLLLQPLLENAMRHGVSLTDGCCRLSLTARVVGNRLALDVRDAGPGLSSASSQPSDQPSGGVGLSNTAQRLRYLYGDDHAFDLRTIDGGGLHVSVDLPFRREPH